MPVNALKTNTLIDLSLRNQNLYSEDIFILSQFLKHNNSLRKINLSKNYIGHRYVEETEVIEMKMKYQDKLKDFSFDTLFYDSLGIEHLTLALQQVSHLEVFDISENDIGPQSFSHLLPIFSSNTRIQSLKVADCNLDSHCCSALCKLLLSNSDLTKLSFRNSALSDEGAEAIA